jgi:hypothetical protein
MVFSLLQKPTVPVFVKPRGRGRPPTHPVDRVRTKLWFNVIKLVSGLPSAYAVEMALDEDHVRKREADVARPRKWDGYEKGATVPVDKPGPRNAVDQAEERFPGTARWFRSPLWAYLRGDPLDARAIEDALRSLEPAVVSVLFEDEPREHERESRQRPFSEESVGDLVAIGSFDALVAAVLLAGLSEVISSPELREGALDVYALLQTPLRALPEMDGIYPELYSLIDSRCKHWVYVSPNKRLEMVIFWQGMPGNSDGPPDPG